MEKLFSFKDALAGKLFSMGSGESESKTVEVGPPYERTVYLML